MSESASAFTIEANTSGGSLDTFMSIATPFHSMRGVWFASSSYGPIYQGRLRHRSAHRPILMLLDVVVDPAPPDEVLLVACPLDVVHAPREVFVGRPVLSQRILMREVLVPLRRSRLPL